ncbi:Flavin containing amine oxidoreductase [Candidatus Methanoperedens nitroreducens]|uniref:Flavin containing amine oxidoreductase n=1 Tax=Candidatus Methanoperedens nitratireducens TaxID=1392998 RepID=A0A062V9F0_9EURY|nr:NAD(P)/FAD-dependent oxidoreductase [Candidatus Methanoperedens nitroreducens]KCZ73183.1 Flavin containing amine oxidoreductase [Candidatus Methanoperedens nitroreducens]MDJ1422868.1 NAD(P)/FAD-dependent oxidoreductase [Candidatus Methanoperedens sp.]
MPDHNTYDAIVVGGGISGLLSALTLGKKGNSILLLEKNNALGGNCRTYEPEDYPGWRVDTGIHAITDLIYGPLRQLEHYFDPGKFPTFRRHNDYYLRKKDGLEKFPSTLPGFLKMNALPAKDKVILAGDLMNSVISRAIFGEKQKAVYDVVSKHRLSKKTMQFVNALSYLLSGLSMEKTSVSRFLEGCGFSSSGKRGMIRRIAETMKLFNNSGYRSQGYPLGGIQSITDGVIASFPKNVEYHKSEEVQKIEKDESGFCVSTPEADYLSDKVIYSGEVKKLPGITEMPVEWSQQVKQLEQATAMTIWLGLKEPIPEFNYNGSEVFYDVCDIDKELFYWLMPVPELAPRNKGLVGVSTIVDPKKCHDSEEKLLNTIYSLVPAIEKNIEMIHTQVMAPEKAAVSLNYFPSIKTPVDGLYVVGTDTDMRSMGITRAGYSVLELLKSL